MQRVVMQRLSYPTETVLSTKTTRNRLVLSFRDSPIKPRYLNYVGRTDRALTIPLISRDPTPCMAETALAMVNI